MSRIGKKLILIPEQVEVKINGNLVIVKGPKGELKLELRPEIGAEIQDKTLKLLVKKETKKSSAFWGLNRALLANMIQGVTQGFEKKLEFEGIGYKAQVQSADLVLNVGFSHPIVVKAPSGINFKVEKKIITVSGIDKKLVGQLASHIRSIKKPEPYKGTGIRYQGEIIIKKAGKKAVTTTKP